jgi:hypothetical protein
MSRRSGIVNRFILSIGFAFLLVVTSSSQGPDDITFTLTTKNGRKMFRMGEAIPVEFHFRSKSENKYELHESFPRERVYYGSPTRFLAEPADDVVDPLGDYIYQFPAAVGSTPPRVWPLGAQNVINEHYVNEWLRFKKPGHYRIVAETNSVTLAGQGPLLETPRKRIPLRSNFIEIDIVAAENGWAESQLQLAIDALENANPFPRSVRSQPLESGQSPVILEASKVLKFLGTPAAARALVRFLDRRNVGEISSGLWASPRRQEVLAAMEQQINEPDFAVDAFWLDRLIWLAAGNAIGPRVPGDPRNPDPQYLTRLSEARTDPKARYVSELSAALAQKRGRARDAAVVTLAEFAAERSRK